MKKTSLNIIIILTSVIGLSGCVNTEATLLLSSPTTVSYQYDPVLHSNAEDAAKKATMHCAKYGKRAELKNASSSTYSFVTVVFDCVK